MQLTAVCSARSGEHISKNERKRLNYATEILTEPSLLFVDEPTTGLDSFMAEIVVNDLKKLASGGKSKQKRTVIATIHQPSSDIFRLFDKLMLLVDGKVVFFGKCEDAVQYFGKQGEGWRCPNHTNPSDFFMRLFVNPKDNVNASTRRSTAQLSYAQTPEALALADGSSSAAKHELVAPAGGSYDRSLVAQIAILFARDLKLRLRSDVAFKATFGRIIMFGIILGSTFPGVEIDNMVVFSLNGVLFFSVFMQFFDILIAQVNSLPFLMPVYSREMKNRSYSMPALFIAKNLCDAIFDVVFTFLWCCALYWPIGFGWYDFDNFLGFYFPLLMLTFVATGAGYMAAFMVDTPEVGFLVAIMLLFPFIIVAGLIVNLNSIPVGFRFLSEISYLRFAYALISTNQWDGYGTIDCSARDYEYFQCRMIPDPATNGTMVQSTFATGQHVLTFMGYINDPGQTYQDSDRDWFRLICAIAVFRTLAFLALFKKMKPKKGGAKTTTADASAEADAMAADANAAEAKGEGKGEGAEWGRQRQEVHLKWNDLGMAGDNGKPILSGLSGEALPGELLAVVGPSGVGKSVLLNCLAGKQTHVGGRSPPLSPDLSLQTAYMYQEDLFLSDITVREQLLFQGKMRLHKDMPVETLHERIDTVIASVGLTKSAHTQIGTIGAGISGGERKRLSFAEQILTDPALLFADEPTSGLDSAMAEAVMEQLRDLARGDGGAKRTVVCTIHQPSSEIYQMFDKLLLLVSDANGCGRTAFFGTTVEALSFFENLQHPCPTFLNPPDHYMRIISSQGIVDAEQKQVAVARAALIYEAWDTQTPVPVLPAASAGATASSSKTSYDAGCGKQFSTLLWREMLLRSRSEQLFQAYCGRTVMMTLIFGLLYYQIDNNQASVQSIMGCITIVFMDTFFTAGIGVVQSVPFTFPTVSREHHNRQYSIGAYFLAKQVADAPFAIIFNVIFAAGTYALFGFTFDPFSKFVNWVMYIVLAALTANGLGYFCAAVGFDPTSSFLMWTCVSAASPPPIAHQPSCHDLLSHVIRYTLTDTCGG